MKSASAAILVTVAVSAAAVGSCTADAGHTPSLDPCAAPLRWHIGTVDPRFDLSRQAFRAAVETAVAVWERPAEMRLFVYDSAQGMPIHLVYDARQVALEADTRKRGQLRGLEEEIDRLEREYDDKVEELNAVVQDHNDTVEQWNERGGAPDPVWTRLQEEREAIDRLRSQVNMLALRIQRAVQSYNEQVREYDRVRPKQVQAGAFEETVVTSGGRERRVAAKLTIYQFADVRELTLVLAHELGHALGLGHVPDPTAIMHEAYRSDHLSAAIRIGSADLAALRQRCRPESGSAELR